MPIIPPRLSQLLNILLDSQLPVSVQELGAKLAVSRRTVFRELENVDILLKPFELKIGTVMGKGIMLEGSQDGRKSLKRQLKLTDNNEPTGKLERQNRLTLALLLTVESQKLFYFSDLLHVSESTISNDLDDIEVWLKPYGLTLIRKQNFGVGIEGVETGLRRACVQVLQRQKEGYKQWSEFPSERIKNGFELCLDKLHSICLWMTPESFEALELYLMVTVQRIIDGFDIERYVSDSDHMDTANKIASLLGSVFYITFSDGERDLLSKELSACRKNTTAIPSRELNRDTELLKLSYRLIEAFDPTAASVLKLDEELLDGLVFHLRPTLLRLRNHVELYDPLLEQISEGYPELMRKTKRAAKLLLEYGGWISESEISFLAMHFGGAVHRLEERGISKRMVRIGIVCINGIGTSYLLASQVRGQFANDAEIEVSSPDTPKAWKRYDMIISTIPLESAGNIPVTVVSPFLSGDSIQRIANQIALCASSSHSRIKEESQNYSLVSHFADINKISGDLQSLLEEFSVISVENDCTFNQLVKLVGYRFGDSELNGRVIYEKIMEREKLSSQVVPELGIVLLHCKTNAVSKPIFAVISPDGGQFTDIYFAKAVSCVLLLMPGEASAQRIEIMGSISGSLVESKEFLDAIRARNKDLILRHLELIFKNYFTNYLEKNWEE